MFGIRIETKIMFSLNNWKRLAMNAYGCTDCVKLVCAGHAGETEQTHNQEKKLLFCLFCNKMEHWEIICAIHMHVANV